MGNMKEVTVSSIAERMFKKTTEDVSEELNSYLLGEDGTTLPNRIINLRERVDILKKQIFALHEDIVLTRHDLGESAKSDKVLLEWTALCDDLKQIGIPEFLHYWASENLIKE